MNYKGFLGTVEYDDKAHIFSGEVINTRTVITFQGTSVDEVEKEFKASVDDYLDWCTAEKKGLPFKTGSAVNNSRSDGSRPLLKYISEDSSFQ